MPSRWVTREVIKSKTCPEATALFRFQYNFGKSWSISAKHFSFTMVINFSKSLFHQKISKQFKQLPNHLAQITSQDSSIWGSSVHSEPPLSAHLYIRRRHRKSTNNGSGRPFAWSMWKISPIYLYSLTYLQILLKWCNKRWQHQNED